MTAVEVIIPSKCCGKWGPEQEPEELTERVTNQEYQDIRNIMHYYRKMGLCTAAGFSIVLVIIVSLTVIATGNYAIYGQMWCVSIPWCLCPPMFISKAKATVNVNILNPKSMRLVCYGCFAYKIVSELQTYGSVGDAAQLGGIREFEAQSVAGIEEFTEKPQPHSDLGKKERERAPANYGTVELTHSSKTDVVDDVVRSMYTHISDGATRGKRIVACNMKIVYVPEEDLWDLVQVYNSEQMGELRVKSKTEDGARRVLRFFYNNGSSLAAGSRD